MDGEPGSKITSKGVHYHYEYITFVDRLLGAKSCDQAQPFVSVLRSQIHLDNTSGQPKQKRGNEGREIAQIMTLGASPSIGTATKNAKRPSPAPVLCEETSKNV